MKKICLPYLQKMSAMLHFFTMIFCVKSPTQLVGSDIFQHENVKESGVFLITLSLSSMT